MMVVSQVSTIFNELDLHLREWWHEVAKAFVKVAVKKSCEVWQYGILIG